MSSVLVLVLTAEHSLHSSRTSKASQTPMLSGLELRHSRGLPGSACLRFRLHLVSFFLDLLFPDCLCLVACSLCLFSLTQLSPLSSFPGLTLSVLWVFFCLGSVAPWSSVLWTSSPGCSIFHILSWSWVLCSCSNLCWLTCSFRPGTYKGPHLGFWLPYHVWFWSPPSDQSFLLLGFPDAGLWVVLQLRAGTPGLITLLSCLWVSRSCLCVSGSRAAVSAQERVQGGKRDRGFMYSVQISNRDHSVLTVQSFGLK